MTLKRRIIPVLLYSGAGLVVTTRFANQRPVGTAVTTAHVHEMRQVDELIFLDIMASREGRGPDFDLVAEVCDQCFMPVTVGGGIKSVEDIRTLLSVGADKVSINTAALGSPSLLPSAALKFGSQAIVASVDAVAGDDAASRALAFQNAGAGEILLQSIDRDGTMDGYDLDLIRWVAPAVNIPVIACGGAGEPKHFEEAFAAGASACAAAAMFQFTDQTPRDVGRHLKSKGWEVRV